MPQSDPAARDPSPAYCQRNTAKAPRCSQCSSMAEARAAEALWSLLQVMFILEPELKDMVRGHLDFLPAGLHSGLIRACQGAEEHT